MAFSNHSVSHSPTVTLLGSMNVPLLASWMSSARRRSASRFVPRTVTHFCCRLRRPVAESVW